MIMNYNRKEIDNDGTVRYYLNGELHRIDGPAIEWANGDKYWYINGQHHRLDGPAIEWADGSKTWWINGKRHRIDGPAVEFSNGNKSWYINGTYYSRSEYYHKLKLLNCPEYMK